MVQRIVSLIKREKSEVARIIIPSEIKKFFGDDEVQETDDRLLYVERSVQGAKKNGPYWKGRAMLFGEWYDVTASPTLSGNAPSQWDIEDPDALVSGAKSKQSEE